MKRVVGVTIFILSAAIGSLAVAEEHNTQDVSSGTATNFKMAEHCMEMRHGMMMRCMKREQETVEKESLKETKDNHRDVAKEEILNDVINKGNPVAADEKSIAQGKIVYSQNCSACHGVTGQGNGPTAQYFSKRVADLTNPKLKEKSDGELFGKITDGTWPMPAFGFSLSKKDVWNTINYIRTLSGAKNSQQ